MKKLACCTIEMPGTKKSWHSHCNIELMTKKNVSKRAQLDVYRIGCCSLPLQYININLSFFR